MKHLFLLVLISTCIGCSYQSVDMLITGGLIVDGTGANGRLGDVAVVGEEIRYVGPRSSKFKADKLIDATGLIVSPGFIDPHTHADSDLRNPDTSLNLAYLHQGVTTVFIGNDGWGEEYGATANTIEKAQPGTNVGLFSGHGRIRREVIGYEPRAPTEAEFAEMRRLLVSDLEKGALGLSTGLFYAPGSFALTEEVMRLAAELKEHGGVYETHIRDESDYTIGLLPAIQETLNIGEDLGIPVHIAHLKALGPSVHGMSEEIVQLVEQAQSRGATVTADQYPWMASGTRLSNALIPRVAMEGGTEALLRRLANAQFVEGIRTDIETNLARRGGPDRLLITGQSEHQGQTLADAMPGYEGDPVNAAVSIVRQGDPSVASFMMMESDVRLLGSQPWVVTSSDGTNGHPRKYGSFPEKYQKFVREWGLLTLEEFVQRSSEATASIFGLCRRGKIQEGFVADLAVWHPTLYRSQATYESPRELASGVEYLLVNGELVIERSTPTNARAGEILRRGQCDE